MLLKKKQNKEKANATSARLNKCIPIHVSYYMPIKAMKRATVQKLNSFGTSV